MRCSSNHDRVGLGCASDSHRVIQREATIRKESIFTIFENPCVMTLDISLGHAADRASDYEIDSIIIAFGNRYDALIKTGGVMPVPGPHFMVTHVCQTEKHTVRAHRPDNAVRGLRISPIDNSLAGKQMIGQDR